MTKKDINRIHCHLLEEMMLEIRSENKSSITRGGGNIIRQTMIYDMHNLSLKQITSKCGMTWHSIIQRLKYIVNYLLLSNELIGIDTLLDFVLTMETHYPEIMRKMIIINGNFPFKT